MHLIIGGCFKKICPAISHLNGATEGPRLTLSRLGRGKGEQGRVFLRFTGMLSGSRSFIPASFPGGRPRAMARPLGEADDSVRECVSVR